MSCLIVDQTCDEKNEERMLELEACVGARLQEKEKGFSPYDSLPCPLSGLEANEQAQLWVNLFLVRRKFESNAAQQI